jgi:tRNA (uracil-5-)-methyltransferase
MEDSVSASVTDDEEPDLALEGDEPSKPDLHNVNDTDNQPVKHTDEEEVPRDNPYAYLDRADFTSEKFKIEIRGLPKFYGIGVGLFLYYLERDVFFAKLYSSM